MEEILKVLTGHGYWTPLIWTLGALGVLLLAFLFWISGRREHKRGTEQELPFLSGERAENPHVGAPHLYWGFVEALKPFLSPLRDWHSGLINDYAGWFLVILAVALLLLAV